MAKVETIGVCSLILLGSFGLFSILEKKRGREDFVLPPKQQIPQEEKWIVHRASEGKWGISKPVAIACPKIGELVRSLAKNDQEGLRKAYLEASHLIAQLQKMPGGIHKPLGDELSQTVPNSGLKESFFVVSAALRNCSRPSEVLEVIWELQGRVKGGPLPNHLNHHHPGLDLLEKWQRIEVYALEELRKRLFSNPKIDETEISVLVERLINRASTEKSLNLTLEVLQTLRQLGAGGAIGLALMNHSPRDRKLLEEVLDLGL